MSRNAEPDRVCDSCGRWVEDKEVLYHARLELYAEPRITESGDDLPRSTDPDEWQRLIDAMERMSDDEVQEATDQVHEELKFVLCPECRRELHQRIRMRRQIL